MKIRFTLFLLFAASFRLNAQPNLTSWIQNTTDIAFYYLGSGMPPTYVLTSTGELANVQRVCYTADTLWIQTTGLTNVMGPYLNPGTPTDQDFVWKLPRNPSAAASPVEVPNVFSTGVLINGVSIFGNGDATSYDPGSNSNTNTGAGLWNVDAWYGEGISLDTAYGAHVNQDGTYHTHATPFNLYTDPSTSHSPLLGWAFDGYPVYGPFGYSDPLNAASAIKRLESGYELRSITTRTTLPDGTTSTPPGPNVSSTFPIGMYIEDYDYTGTGDLDEHNGRFCLTPEFPSGTYAYFVSTTSTGEPWYPYYFGVTYYGNVVNTNLDPMNPQTVPTSGVSCAIVSNEESTGLENAMLVPNPAGSNVTLRLSENATWTVSISGLSGNRISESKISGNQTGIDAGSLPSGIYIIQATAEESGKSVTLRLAKD